MSHQIEEIEVSHIGNTIAEHRMSHYLVAIVHGVGVHRLQLNLVGPVIASPEGGAAHNIHLKMTI